ncbi:GtrA family protein [uncultured Helicobacter sp.]|uniref:GtrA family protein n=1 Tax=uncultured Helicobacter sp. TaxID=175537 RepID=UPI00374F2A1F
MSHKSPKAHWQRFYKYGIVGASAALINLAVFALCEKIFGIYYLLSTLIAFVLATYWNFILARKFVFVSTYASALKESLLIYLVSALGACIDMGVMYVGVDVCELDSVFTKVLAIGVAFVFNFGLRNFVIYKERV